MTGAGMEKWSGLVAWAAVTAYVALALVFYRERMLFLDGPHFLVELFQTGWFHTPGHRFSGYLIQLLPLAGIRLGAGVEAVAFLYSLNIALFAFAVFLVLERVYGNRLLSLGWAVFLWAITYDSFYMPVSELPIGLGFLFLLVAHFGRRRVFPGLSWLAPAMYAVHLAASHPLVVFALAFLMAAALPGTALKESLRLDQCALRWLLFTLALAALRFATGGDTEWEKASRLAGFADQALNLFQGNPVNHHLRIIATSVYLPAVLAGLICVSILVVRRYWSDALLFTAFSVLYVLIFAGTHPDWDVRPFTEIYFLALALPLALYIALLALNLRSRTATAILAVCLILQAARVGAHAGFFRERAGVLEAIALQQHEAGISMAVIPFHRMPVGKIAYPFAAGYESLVVSALAGLQPPVTFTFVHADTVLATDTAGTQGYFLVSDWNRKPGIPGRPGPLQLQEFPGYRPFYPEVD